MQFCFVNKPRIVNIFGIHSLHQNITHLAVITQETTIKMEILK